MDMRLLTERMENPRELHKTSAVLENKLFWGKFEGNYDIFDECEKRLIRESGLEGLLKTLVDVQKAFGYGSTEFINTFSECKRILRGYLRKERVVSPPKRIRLRY